MIGKLRGIVDGIDHDTVILDVGGVGYLVFCSDKTLAKLPPTGQVATLLIDTKIAEDRFDLVGFYHEAERLWFRELNKISGVSTRTALAILSVLTPDTLARAIATQDVQAFKKISGIGPKLSQRLIVELSGKVPALETLPPDLEQHLSGSGGTSKDLHDAISALTNLGYTKQDATKIITRLAKEEPTRSVSELIRHGLKELAA